MRQLVEALRAFFITRRLSSARLSRAQFEQAQARALQAWARRSLPKVRARHAAPPDPAAWPVMDKAQLMADFAGFNKAGITASQVAAALEGDCRIGDLTVGASTGTSGNRGYFVISERERYRWLGSLLAKAMPDLLLRRRRVAVVLPQNTRLYDSARGSGRIALRFFNITSGPESFVSALEDFAPDVLVAPPRFLTWLAARGSSLRPLRIFSAAETLDPADRAQIEAWSGRPLRQIYMATEGLLAVSCHEGGLHLCEDSVFFEYEPVGEGLVSPLITCFRRDQQIMARYRMNDLLRLAPGPCRCGSPLQLVAEVVGRVDDAFEMIGQDGAPRLVTPDALRNALVAADPQITDYRIVQLSADQVELVLPLALPAAVAAKGQAALERLFEARDLRAKLRLRRAALEMDPARKLRRVECRLPRPGGETPPPMASG